MRARFLVLPVAVVAAGAVAAVPGAVAAHHRAHKKVVTVGDDFFSPASLTKSRRVKVGTTIAWRWSSDNQDTHDVKLTKGPKGVRHFHSRPATAGYVFRRKLTKPGVYHLLCTFHAPEMKQTIRVVR
jgi:plastocyanin